MKQKLILLLVAWLPIAAFCDDVKVDKLWYSLNSDFTATVISSSDDEYSGDIEIPESIKIRQGDNEIEYAVTSINDDAFKNCKSLTSVVIPNSITVIGGHSAYYFRESYINSCGAFMGCENLTSVSIGNKVKSIGSYVFSNCKSLTSITIPNSVETIGSRAFEYCSNLASISIGNGVNKIGQEAFYTCSNLDKVIITDIAAWCKIQFVYDNSGYNVATDNVPSNPLWSAHNLFLNEEELTDLIIPEGVTEINKYAFLYCSSLKSVTLPEGLTSIGISAFLGCSNLTSITIPSSVSNISNIAFRVCPSLTSVTVLAKEPIFEDDSGIRDFSNKANATLYVPKGSKAAYEAADNWKGFKEILELGEEVPDLKDGDTFTALTTDGVEMTFKVISAADKTCQVGSGKFSEAAVDKAYQGPVTIPATINEYKVTSVGDYAFKGTYITSAIISEGVEAMGSGIFRGCRYLKELGIPSTVKSIGENTFVVLSDDAPVDGYVTDVETVISHIMEPFEISTTVFGIYNPGPDNGWDDDIIDEECARAFTRAVSGYSTNATLYVPSGTIEKYKAIKGWTMFKEIVEMGGEDPDLKDGDVFTALPPEGVEMTFKVISAADKTCQLGDGENCSFSTSYNGTITIPAMANGFSVITIAPWACGNSNITAAIIPQGILNIEDRAFGFCSNLLSISLPEGLKRIGNNIVWGCAKLSSFHVPSTVQEFDTQFGWCNALEEITVAEGNAIYDSRDNCNAVIAKATNTLISGCKATVIPNTVENLGTTSFGFLTNLTEMIIPEGVKTLDNQVFAYTSLSTITIPSTVTSIGSMSFQDCNNLVEVRINSRTPFPLRDDVFTDIAYNGTLYVPFGCKSLYDAADGWSNFQNIVEMDEEESPILKDGDTFTALTPEGVEMTFKVISADGKTCQVGTGSIEGPRAIDKKYKGPITIPATANGFKVTGIGNFAFYDTQITSATISEGVENIGRGAFRCYFYLKTLELPSTIKSIGEQIIAYFLDIDMGEVYHNNVVSIVSHATEPIDIPDNAFGFDTKYYDEEGILMDSELCRAATRGMEEDDYDYYVNGLNRIRATLYVPTGTLSKYKVIKGWTMFKEVKESLQGDANTDGKVGNEDVELVKEYIMTGNAEGLIITNADTNGNKQLNVADIVKIINIIKSNNSKETPDPESAGPQHDMEDDDGESFD